MGILELPNDIKYQIFEFLNNEDLLNFGATCKTNRQLINTPQIWISRILTDFSIEIKTEEIEYLSKSKNILSEYAKLKHTKLASKKLKEYERDHYIQYNYTLNKREDLVKFRIFFFVCCIICVLIFMLVGSILIPLHLDGIIDNKNPWMWLLGYSFVSMAASVFLCYSFIDSILLRIKPLILLYVLNPLKVLFFLDNFFERKEIGYHAEDISLKFQNIVCWIPFALIAALIGKILDILGYKVWRILSIPVIILIAFGIIAAFDQARMQDYPQNTMLRYFKAVEVLLIHICMAIEIGLCCAKLDGALQIAWTKIFIPAFVILPATVAWNIIIWMRFDDFDLDTLVDASAFTLLLTCNMILPTVFIIIFGLTLDKFINISFTGVFALLWGASVWCGICVCSFAAVMYVLNLLAMTRGG